jgi:hypothetical protein
MKRSHEGGHVLVSFHAAEAPLRFRHAQGHPSTDHALARALRSTSWPRFLPNATLEVQQSAMNLGKGTRSLLLVFALGCGSRSALDVFGLSPASGGTGQSGTSSGVSTDDGGMGSSSSGGGSSSGGDASSSGAVAMDSGGSSSGMTFSCGSPGTSADSGLEPSSCQPGGPGMTNCGDGGESCCTSLEVPAGTYDRT